MTGGQDSEQVVAVLQWGLEELLFAGFRCSGL